MAESIKSYFYFRNKPKTLKPAKPNSTAYWYSLYRFCEEKEMRVTDNHEKTTLLYEKFSS